MNFHTTKGTGRNNKKVKVSSYRLKQDSCCTVLIVTNLKIARKRQKDEHDQSSVKIPPKSTLGLFW